MQPPPNPAGLAAAHPALAPGAALLRAAPRLSRRRATVLMVVFLVLFVAATIVVALPLCVLAGVLSGTMLLTQVSIAACTSVTTVTGLGLTAGAALGTLVAFWVLRRWGGPNLQDVGLRCEATWVRELVLGAALGPVVFALVLATELALGWAQVERGTVGAGGLLLAALSFVGVAVNEELAARGFLLRMFGRAWSPRVALIGSSLIFAVLHGGNPNVTPLAIAFLFVAGLALAWGYFATGRLWLPIAFHWSWNLAQGPLFGFPVSGLDSASVLAVNATGPAWATGGAFGPEAGILGLLAEAVAAVAILAWRRGDGSAAATAVVAVAGVAALGWLLILAR
ncbi:MAG TPA: CPBP family intramembrane glutamic endopeptidase [Chloroflexota bacterium]|jgi:hypothetical protein